MYGNYILNGAQLRYYTPFIQMGMHIYVLTFNSVDISHSLVQKLYRIESVKIFHSLANTVTKVHITEPNTKKLAKTCMRIF